MSEDNTVLLAEQRENISIITLNRPQRHHAIDAALGTAIVRAVEQAERDDDIRVIIIRGSGDKAFCAGQDMVEMSATADSERKPVSSSAGLAVERVAHARKPVIAAINGICYGGGAMLALACDIRLASTSAVFRFPGTEYGLIVGAAWLPRVVGTSKAKEWIYTARKIDASEACASGFLSHVFARDALMDEALAMAALIAANSAIAVRESKRVIDAATLVRTAQTMEREINQDLRSSEEQTARFKSATTKVTGKQA